LFVEIHKFPRKNRNLKRKQQDQPNRVVFSVSKKPKKGPRKINVKKKKAKTQVKNNRSEADFSVGTENPILPRSTG